MSEVQENSMNSPIALVERLRLLIATKLWLQIMVFMFLGIVVGLLISPNGAAIVSSHAAQLIAGWLVLPGHVFLALIQMIMLPLVVSSIILGIADTGDVHKLRNLGLRIAPYFVFTTALSVIIGVILVTLIQPGYYIDMHVLVSDIPDASLPVMQENKGLETFAIHDEIIKLIPTNPLNAALNESMLQLVIFSIFIGAALVKLNPSYIKPLTTIIRSVRELSMVIVGWAMLLAPFAVFGLLAQVTMKVGVHALVGMSVYVGTVLLGLIILLSLYVLLVCLVGKIKPSTFMSHLKELQLLAFSTSSSAAVMPFSIKVAEEKLAIRPSTANFIIPLGSTINMDGTALYQVVAAIFLTQVFGIDLSSGQLLLLIATTIGASIGSPSTPGVGIVILASILMNIGIPASGIALIVGVDRILDMSRTSINVTGDIAACVVIDKWLARDSA